MEATPWGLCTLPFTVLELQPGEKSRICQTGNAFLWWAKLWRGRWRTCFIWVTSSFPSFQRQTSPSVSARRENSTLHLHVRVTLGLGRRKQRAALSSDQSGTKERARSPRLHPENRFMGNWFKKYPNSTSEPWPILVSTLWQLPPEGVGGLHNSLFRVYVSALMLHLCHQRIPKNCFNGFFLLVLAT